MWTAITESGTQPALSPQRRAEPAFDGVRRAVEVRESAAYQRALDVLSDAVERDFRIVEGID